MRFTLIVEDSTVGIDGEFRKVTLPALNNVRAVQFNNGSGHVEYFDMPNTTLEDLTLFQNIIQLWHDAAPPAPVPPTLDELKALKKSELNSARDNEEACGFTYLGHVFDSDARSVQRIAIAAQTAQLDANFSIGWTAKDNIVVQLNQAQMLQMPAALAMHAYTLHEKARQLKALADAALTQAELDVIVW